MKQDTITNDDACLEALINYFSADKPDRSIRDSVLKALIAFRDEIGTLPTIGGQDQELIMDDDDAHHDEVKRLEQYVRSLRLALAGMLNAYAPKARDQAAQHLQSDVRRALQIMDQTDPDAASNGKGGAL